MEEHVQDAVSLELSNAALLVDAGGRAGPVEEAGDARVDEDVLSELGLDGSGDGWPLIDLFLGETTNRIDRLRAALEAGQLDEGAGAAHSLKGTSGSFGACALSARAAEAEVACKDGDAATAARLVPVLVSEFEAFRDILAVRFQPPTETSHAG